MAQINASRLTRRSFLAATAVAAVAASGCRSSPAPAPAAPAPTVASLTANSPFYIAHRGGGGDWPEMTAYAYEQASRIPGLQALEISVCLSADGVLVCSHDPTTTRVTGTDYTIAKETWTTLSTLYTKADKTTDPGQPARPLARFDEIAARYIDRFVLFVEPKVPAAEGPLLQQLTSLGNPERVVWKQPLTSAGFGAAKDAGYATWGYVLDDPSFLGANLTRLSADPRIEMLGIPVFGPGSVIQAARAAADDQGKQTIAWPITTNAERERALGFGAAGLMTSNIAELMPPPPPPATSR